ncbi:MAG: spore maturation protein [Oscillospiraceae bacterium]|jgi:spore maturation protein B|nr:spore maturation protein [Oscillospiraceae bacterium]
MIWQLITPLLILGIALYALLRGVDIFAALIAGARDGLNVLLRIVPALVPLLAAITMLRASGFLDAFAEFCRPAFQFLGIPPECAPLLIVRPFSGSGALAVGVELMRSHGADSLVGRTAAVMLGSTETTFYAVSVICGAAGVTKTRYVIPAALLADFAGYITASAAVRWLFT